MAFVAPPSVNPVNPCD